MDDSILRLDLHDERFATASLPASFMGRPLSLFLRESHEERRVSAVCMIFIPSPRGSDFPADVLLTRRSANLRSHGGQIGFPGGRAEPSDQSLVATALRETEEELGIGSAHLKFHGALAPLHALDGHLVQPFVATAAVTLDELTPSPDEVAGVIPVPWLALRREASSQFSFTLFGRRRDSLLFPHDGHKIWGLTAKMIYSADLRP